MFRLVADPLHPGDKINKFQIDDTTGEIFAEPNLGNTLTDICDKEVCDFQVVLEDKGPNIVKASVKLVPLPESQIIPLEVSQKFKVKLWKSP